MALGLLLVRLLMVAAVVAGGLPRRADAGGLAVGFYNKSCPQAEDLALAEMRDIVEKDKTLAPALLRFMFHDCFVRGCDGSIMLVSRNGTGERDALPSHGLRGYGEIERIKAKLEQACPLTVSCADIIVMAARDAVYLSDGPRYAVETGRRDGKVSAAFDANNDVPPPSSNIVDLKTYFSVKSLGWKDLVVLSGNHTIGWTQCSTFAGDRLYNYSGRGVQDPSLNKKYAADLRQACEAGVPDDETVVAMDPVSPYTFDLAYYHDVYNDTGLFLSDQALLDDQWTREYVAQMAAAASPDEYFRDYAVAMTNMGRIEVLTGDSGEIRKVCGAYVD
ncbi:peroxidase 1-like isoform X2 [Phragmites australis]|uniref:peroxidase 1-like isoform X2 n=1 Tax=Phragmites australis TaxID=29695 RepID=UPI002D79B356|nr:peroxidase 1-like isoform X2 [Phragmites australis]